MVLELTLKHVKALSALLEQQQQKIIALQKDLQISKFDAVVLRRRKKYKQLLFVTHQLTEQSVASVRITLRDIVR